MEPMRPKWKPSETFYSNLLLVACGVVCYMAISHLDAVGAAVSGLLHVLSPFLAGLVLAYVLDFIVRALDRGALKKHRGLRVLIAYAIAIVLLSGLLSLVVPQVIESATQLIGNIPAYTQQLTAFLDDLAQRGSGRLQGLETFSDAYEKAVGQLTGRLAALMPQLLSYGRTIGSGVVNTLTALIASVYMLLDKERLLAQLHRIVDTLLPQRVAADVFEVCHIANRIFSGFVGGKMIDSIIIGILCTFLCGILRLPYAVLIGAVVGITNVIPVFGPFLGAIPCFIILVIIDPFASLRFLVMILALQQFDGNILGPKILGNSTGISALGVLFSISVGGSLFGFVGMLVGVPTFALLTMLFDRGVNHLLAQRGIDGEGNPVNAPAAEETGGETPPA